MSASERTAALFDGYGLSEVARLIDVAAAAYGDVISEQLQRQDLQNRSHELGSGRNFDHVIGSLASEVVAVGDDGNDDAVTRLHFLDVGHALLVTGHRIGIGFIAGGEHDDGQVFVNEG